MDFDHNHLEYSALTSNERAHACLDRTCDAVSVRSNRQPPRSAREPLRKSSAQASQRDLSGCCDASVTAGEGIDRLIPVPQSILGPSFV